MKTVTKFQVVDGQIAREVNALARKGIPKGLATELVKELPEMPFEERLWEGVRRAMEASAEEGGGAMWDEEEWAEEDLAAAVEEENESLSMVLEEGMLTERDGGAHIEIRPATDLSAYHTQYAADVTLIIKKPSSYPSESPRILLTCTAEVENTAFTREINKRLWNHITTELVGQPVIYALVSSLEADIPEVLDKYYKEPVPEVVPKRKGKGGKGGKGGGGGGGAREVHNEKHSGLMTEILKEQEGDGKNKKTKVPQIFPELTDFEVKVQGPAAARSGDREWPGIEKNTEVDARLVEKYQKRICNKEGLPEQRAKLPAAKLEETLLDVIKKNQVTLVTGETGCGKTTQVPQFVLDDMLRNGEGSQCRIVCTQPRRIAATSIAKRVASERAENIGGQVGYSIRLESKQSADTRLLFCTTGILLRRLQGSKNLDYLSHIVVDEVHERSLDSDFLLIFLQDLIKRRPNIKIILMSASVNADLFSEYFDNCPVVHIPGFTHPVEIQYCEDVVELTNYTLEEESSYCLGGGRRGGKGKGFDDGGGGGGTLSVKETKNKEKMSEYFAEKKLRGISKRTIQVLERMNEEVVNNELIVELISAICFGKYQDEPGAILVFLPGMQEINTLYEEINSDRRVAAAIDCHRLHSSVSNQEQEGVFLAARRNKRKVVLSTNIAETSVTIDDIVFVIDAGKHKETRYAAQQGMNKLQSRWISQANAKQRKGRAGRVRPGYCFRMYTSFTHECVFQTFQECEMTRVPLQNLLLQIRILNFGEDTDTDVLHRAIEAPKDSSVKACRDSLQDIGAIGPKQQLTSLGLHLANLPLDPKLGKLLLHGWMLRCLDPCLTVAAALSSKSPFVTPYDRKNEADLAKKYASRKSRSDHIATLNAYNDWLVLRDEGGPQWRQKEREHAAKRFISISAMTQIQQTKQQYYGLLQGMGLLGDVQGGVFRTTGSDGEARLFELGGREFNQYSVMRQAIKASLVAGFTPNVVRIKYSRNTKNPRPFLNEQNGDVAVHPSSVCGSENQYPHPLLVYYEKVCGHEGVFIGS